jgi:hypothetical protein
MAISFASSNSLQIFSKINEDQCVDANLPMNHLLDMVICSSLYNVLNSKPEYANFFYHPQEFKISIIFIIIIKIILIILTVNIS